jgi:U3 small nucleolar RNA-associated protein MPP10
MTFVCSRCELELVFTYFTAITTETPSVTSSIDQLLLSLASSHAPETRSAVRKRKRSLSPVTAVTFSPTPLSSLLVEGMDDDQIWAQLELRTEPLCKVLSACLDSQLDNEEGLTRPLQLLSDEEIENLTPEQLAALEEVLDEGAESGDESDGSESHDDFSESSDSHDSAEDISELRDPDDDEESWNIPRKREQASVNGIDDGFFDLLSFNAETEQTESRSVSTGRLNAEDDSSSDDMPIDLFNPIDIAEALDGSDLEMNPGGSSSRLSRFF